MLGRHCIRSWSSTQATVAQSSGEAEYYAMLKGASIALGVARMSGELGFGWEVELRSDSSAGIGMVQRRGLGKVRHVEICYLWLQERVAKEEVRVTKVGTNHNWGDVGTKHLDRNRMVGLCEGMGFYWKSGRCKITPEVAKDAETGTEEELSQVGEDRPSGNPARGRHKGSALRVVPAGGGGDGRRVRFNSVVKVWRIPVEGEFRVRRRGGVWVREGGGEVVKTMYHSKDGSGFVRKDANSIFNLSEQTGLRRGASRVSPGSGPARRCRGLCGRIALPARAGHGPWQRTPVSPGRGDRWYPGPGDPREFGHRGRGEAAVPWRAVPDWVESGVFVLAEEAMEDTETLEIDGCPKVYGQGAGTARNRVRGGSRHKGARDESGKAQNEWEG